MKRIIDEEDYQKLKKAYDKADEKAKDLAEVHFENKKGELYVKAILWGILVGFVSWMVGIWINSLGVV